jgi:hypothetical protein
MDLRGRVFLITIIAALLIVGLVSETILRHVIQVIPLALALTMRKTSYRAAASLPLFVFWLGIVTLIWLFLLNLSTIASGTFSKTEVALTVVIGFASLLGMRASIPPLSTERVSRSLALAALFGSLQVICMWASFHR